MAKKKNLPLEEAAQQRLTLAFPDEEKSGVDQEQDRIDLATEDATAQELAEIEESEDYLTVGDRLRREREKQGLNPHQMAEQLRLRPRQIIALENGDYNNLPGQAFVTGFLRSYANALGLDAVALVGLYKSEHEGTLRAPQLAFPEPTSEGRMPGGNLIIGTCLAAVIAFSSWYYLQNSDQAEMDLVPDLPDRLAAKLKDFTSANSITETANTSLPAPVETQKQEMATFNPTTSASVNPPAVEAEADTLSVQTDDLAEEKSPENKVPDESNTASVLAPSGQQTEKEPEETSAILENPESQPAEQQKTETTETTAEQDPAPASDVAAVPETLSAAPAPPREAEPASESAVSITDIEQPSTEPPAATLAPAQTLFPQTTLSNDSTTKADVTSESIPETLGVENSDARIILQAHQETWIQVVGADQGVVLERILEPGDTYMVPVKTGLKLNAANAGGLEVRLDGTVLGSLGGYGRIIRDLALEPENLRTNLPASTQ